MNEHTDTQIILQDGKPAFAVIPWEEYQDLINRDKEIEKDIWIPQEIVKQVAIGEVSMIRAWRESLI